MFSCVPTSNLVPPKYETLAACSLQLFSDLVLADQTWIVFVIDGSILGGRQSFMRDLFSVIVITYNQQGLIEECLNSILEQDYKYIELIVSDDCSTDSTAELADRWLAKHGDHFVSSELVVSEQNLGIVNNKARGLRESTANYIKSIAGDDLLESTALSEAKEIFDSEGVEVFAGTVRSFRASPRSTRKLIQGEAPSRLKRAYFRFDASAQFRKLCISNFVGAAGVFYTRAFLEKYFSRTQCEFKMMEDWPTWLYATLDGISIPFFEGPIVYYRLHENSLSQVGNDFTDNKKAMMRKELDREILKLYELIVFPNIDRLSAIEKLRSSIRYEMFKEFYEKGIVNGDLRKAIMHKYRLRDPEWWILLPARFVKKAGRVFSDVIRQTKNR